jgi:fatty-acyl-CoA synthase
MHPALHAAARPDRPAWIMGLGGEVVTYRALETRANRLASLLRRRGLRPGDGIAILLPNHPRFFEVAWAAQRAGLYYTPINRHLTADEVEFIVNDCGARALVTTRAFEEVARALAGRTPRVELRLVMDGPLAGWEPYEEAVAGASAAPLADASEGSEMLYSSGTTGRPKGVRKPLAGLPLGDPASVHVQIALGLRRLYGADEQAVYLCPAPLYHGAPLVTSMAMQRLGATVVLMERFDALASLRLIERHRVTHAFFVPTMFVRLLKLPEAERRCHDLSSLRVATHAGAPCPVEVKRQMMAWWGPVLYEYYAGTENLGATTIGPEEWLAHPGSVGRPTTEVHIVGPDGEELPAGVPGTVYFAGGVDFEYHNDPEKTVAIRHPRGWRTLGDVGYVDAEGWLYLTDRAIDMIVSGGVNIYPREIENVLVLHPRVADVAVFGVPDPEFGEAVKAVVQPVDVAEAGPALAAELVAYCRERLAAFKCPRSVDFEPALPRDPNGKLYKRRLRERYWQGRASRII